MPLARVVPRRSRESRGRKDGRQAAMTPIYIVFGVSIIQSSLVQISDKSTYAGFGSGPDGGVDVVPRDVELVESRHDDEANDGDEANTEHH